MENTQYNKIIESQSISLPKGGGSLTGLGGTFKPDLFSGMGAYSIEIPLTHARNFTPQLRLNYNSGTENGIFGLGFSLTLSKISIRIDKQIPQYNNLDSYVLNGMELVLKNETFSKLSEEWNKFEYYNKIEAEFSLIEQYVKSDGHESYWKVTNDKNEISWYGRSESLRISDPNDSSRIFEWLIDESINANEDRIVYCYKADNNKGISNEIWELNRHYANKYIHSIEYGNYFSSDGKEKCAFEIVFDYGEYDISEVEKGMKDPYTPVAEWQYRPDAFSRFSSGFEIRTSRLCRNIMLFHHLENELGAPCLVKKLKLTYKNQTIYCGEPQTTPSLLTSTRLTGYRRNGRKATDTYRIKRTPSLNFDFSEFFPPEFPKFRNMEIDGKEIPGFRDEMNWQTTDFRLEGISGLLYYTDAAVYYCEPLGGGQYARPNTLKQIPAEWMHKDVRNVVLGDLEGNGELELVVSYETEAGYYQKMKNETWSGFRPFHAFPTDLIQGNYEMAVLTGNGKNDALLVDQQWLQIYSSVGKEGYLAAKKQLKPRDFPSRKEGLKTELVAFANLLGDGLMHRIRVSNGSVECWPNLGYGKFGSKICLGNAPVFGADFDSSMLYLADVDGSGTTDLIYARRDSIELYMNNNGNYFSDAITIHLPEPFTAHDQISFADINGNGTSCLVFIKSGTRFIHYYYDFVGTIRGNGEDSVSLKPYLLNKIDNNMGAVTHIQYVSSTSFYLEDKKRGRPWITSLPFPVQVVERIRVSEEVTGSCYTQRFYYHDGYYDSTDREFRGFGCVETWDTECFGKHDIPPTHTITWHHTGALGECDNFSTHYKNQYFSKDQLALEFSDSVLENGSETEDTETIRQAHAALKGHVIRTEVYGGDKVINPKLSEIPYTVEESNFTIRILQQRREKHPAVFTVNMRESILYHYERNCEDPKIQQTFCLETDKYGNCLQSCTVFLPRREVKGAYPEQLKLKAILECGKYTQTECPSVWIHTQCEEYSLELSGLELSQSNYFGYEEVKRQVNKALDTIIPHGLPFEEQNLQARPYSWNRYYFWDRQQENCLPLKSISDRGLLHHIETAVFSSEFVNNVYKGKVTDDLLQSEGGYVYDADSDYWWNRGMVQYYFKPDIVGSFYQPSKTENSFVDESSRLFMRTEVKYDSYFLIPIGTRQYLNTMIQCVSSGKVDYITCKLQQHTDINNNVSQVLFDPLGQVVVSSLYGTENDVEVGGMKLYADETGLTEYQMPGSVVLKEIMACPNDFIQGAHSFFYYDLDAWVSCRQPSVTVNLVRCEYFHCMNENQESELQQMISYSDGLGREIEKKQLADEGQWLVSSRKMLNNKGKVFKEYLPYFSQTCEYENQQDIIFPPPTITHYDPLGREIRVDTPKGFFSKIERNAWEERRFDENNTIKDSEYYQLNYPDKLTDNQRDAIDKSLICYQNPNVTITDNVGNIFLQIRGEHISYYRTDIKGRNLVSADPRFYKLNRDKASKIYNFEYCYAMNKKEPAKVTSCDGGVQWFLNSMYEKQIWSLTARNYCQLIMYDRWQRKTEVRVSKIEQDQIITNYNDFRIAEIFRYGEGLTTAMRYNLNGQLYEIKDQSGITENSRFSMQGEILRTSRRLTKNYDKTADWKEMVDMENQLYVSEYEYNATKHLIKETTPDSSVVRNSYNLTGLLCAVTLETADKEYQQILKRVEYNPQGQRTLIYYGNGVRTNYRYENTTLRLTGIKSKRITEGDIRKELQNIEYFYDPVGNVTRTIDYSIQSVFYNGQFVEPVMDFTYNVWYQLIKCSGRQHRGTDAYGAIVPTSDAGQLENYIEMYTYDASNNLIKRKHLATSGSWTKETAVDEFSNQLKGMEYNACGDMKRTDINSGTKLSYNCCDMLVKSTIVSREEGMDDCEYYLYDSTENRSRKVTERVETGGLTVRIEDKIYLGNLEIKRTYTRNTGAEKCIIEQQGLRVMDDKNCVAIAYFNQTDKQHPQEEGKRQYRFQLDNNIGSVAMETDVNSLIITYEEYFPYGGTALVMGINETEIKRKEYHYSGKEKDDSIGLYYYGVRYYVPWFGRWVSPDPTGPVDGMNLYAFVGGNPIGSKDMHGRWKYIPMAVNALRGGHKAYSAAQQNGYGRFGATAYGIGGAALAVGTSLLGSVISASCITGAQTFSMAITSTLESYVYSSIFPNSVDTTTSFGGVAVNWSTGNVAYPFKKGNTRMDNFTLIAGLTANVSDLAAGRNGTNVELLTQKDRELISHSAIVSKKDGILISVGPQDEARAPLEYLSHPFTKFAGKIWNTYEDNSFKVQINNVNKNTLKKITDTIANTANTTLEYSLLTHSCVGHAGEALLEAGVLTGGRLSIHPGILMTIMNVRNSGIRMNPSQCIKGK